MGYQTTQEDKFDEWLNEVYGTVKIAGLEFDTARALKKLDPIAYRCAKADWEDVEDEDTERQK